MATGAKGAKIKTALRKDLVSNLHIWVPDLFSATGGIQAFSRYLIEAVQAEALSNYSRVLIKNDSPDDVQDKQAPHNFNACGHWPLQLRSQRFAFECLHRAWRERPKLIVSTHLNFGPLAMVARRSLGIPYVLVAHGVDAWRITNASRRRALQKANLTLAVSHYTRDRLIREAWLDSNRVKILPNTFDAGRFEITPKPPQLLRKYGLRPDTPVILTVCRLEETERYKGYDQIIKAMPEILRFVPNARYLLVGKGSDRSRIEKLVAEAGVQEAVILAGFVPDGELAEHYNLCDLFAMPSRAEGFGIVYLEALACGKPVLAGNKDGSRDALADGDLGLLVDPDDTEEIATEIIRVLRREHSHPKIFHPELLRRRVIELFGFEAFKRAVVDLLEPFLDGHENRAERASGGRRRVAQGR
jgi:glycosyltransferase involved in cell wall biosynthesis